MPADVDDTVDPYTSSQQWSRRFIGLKLFLSLAVAGRAGYAEQLDHDVALGGLLRDRLTAAGWWVTNSAALPVVCFADPAADRLDPEESWLWHCRLARSVVEGGAAWISPVRPAGRAALRACVISLRTTAEDVTTLVDAVERSRAEQQVERR